MKQSPFIHLHVHSHYSLLNGLTQIKPLVKAAKKRGFDALALTDYGVLYGAIEFYKACRAEDIKPIIGVEVFVVDNPIDLESPDDSQNIHNLVLLAENYQGYRNLMLIVSHAQTKGLYNNKPCIDKATLQSYAHNIIALSGSIEGEIASKILQGKSNEAEDIAKQYEAMFGKDNFYLELQDHPALEGQEVVNSGIVAIAKNTGIPLVASRNVHYLDPDQAEAQDILLCIGNGWKVHFTDRADYRHVDRSLCTADIIEQRFAHVPEAIANTRKIADRINIEIELDNWHFAPVELPPGKTADEHLRDEAYKHAPHFYPDMSKEVTDRIDYELDIIKTKGYAPYFICIADVVKYAKANGIVESTRGSAAGSLVSYVLGITTVDPIRFKLPFERFLNPFRPSPPDIDTDFADDRRDEMIQYVTEKYGKDKVAQIITFGTMAARAAVKDVGRALGISYGFCDQVAKLIPPGAQGFPMTIERALKEEPDFKTLYETNEEVQRLVDLASQVEGCARHTSIHAAGVVISPTPLTDFCPIEKESGGDRIVTQYSMYDIEAAGVLKNDFLGIRNLSILGKAVEIVKATKGEDVDVYNLPLDDKPTFDMFARGETMGVFQFGSSGMTRWVKELKPTTIDDIMAMVALYRPGPMDFIPEYIARAHDPSKIDYPHPDLEDILDLSLGLLIYQDDVMLTAIKLAGYDWLEADKFRKAMGKKIPELMIEQEKKFKDGCIANNIPKETVHDLWERIKPFATYAFNKAHASSYGIVAYQTAYMKAHYPVQFMTAVLAAEAGDADKVSAISAECDRMGIKVLPPDINESFRNFAMVSKEGEPGRIRFGLSAVKNVGEHICEVIYTERKKNGAYTSLEDFIERICDDKDFNKRSIQSLIRVGAFDFTGIDRGVLDANLENILQYAKILKEKRTTHQVSLFSGTDIALDTKVSLKDAPEATMEQKLEWEKTLLGIYVSSHPFAYYQDRMKDTVTPLADVEQYPRDEWVITGGVIDKVQKKITKKGSIMLFVTMQDKTGSMEYLVFPKTYERTKEQWEEGKVVIVVGKTPQEEGENKVYAEKAYDVTKDNWEQLTRQLHHSPEGSKKEKTKDEEVVGCIEISISPDNAKDMIDTLKPLLDEYPGKAHVYLLIGAKKIKGSMKVEKHEALIASIEEVVGVGNVRIF